MNACYQKELLSSLARDDGMALASIYRHFWQPLFVSAYTIIRDKKACEDIVQEIFLGLWQRRGDLQIKTSLKGYLLAATRYQVFRYIKRAGAKRLIYHQLADRYAAASPDDPLLQKDLARQVHRVVARLPAKCRLVYQLSREELLTHKEIALRLNLSIKTVENHLSSALRKLRCSLCVNAAAA